MKWRPVIRIAAGILLLSLLLACDESHTAVAQKLVVDLGASSAVPTALLPGYFHNNLTSTGSVYFHAIPGSFNCLRTFEINWKLRTTASHAAFIEAVKSLRSWHEDDARKTDVLVIQLNAMPSWLSRSSDTTRVMQGDNIRFYETVPPADVARWDSLMRDMASVIRDWNLVPYYELWNEPDLEYWNGNEAELIELYRHTAAAITSADPTAKVGGFGMSAWNRNVDKTAISVIGYYPDSLAERTATLAHLIDSCAVSGTPLDFVSWHCFTAYAGMLDYGYDYIARKLASRGFPEALQIITEYNASAYFRERKWHAPFILSMIDRVSSYPRFRHAFAAFQDFSRDPNREFFGEWGAVSRSDLQKPVAHALYLLSRAFGARPRRLDVLGDTALNAIASISSDTVRLLLSRYVPPPQYAAYNTILFGDARLNTNDLAVAGYRSWGEIDSTIQGLLPPKGDTRIRAAFQNAQAEYVHAQQGEYRTISVEMVFRGARGGSGFLCRVDSSNNNMITRYDSLTAAGWSRAQAVEALLQQSQLRVEWVTMVDSGLTMQLPPNGIVYLEMRCPQGTNCVHAPPDPVAIFDAYPNPFSRETIIQFAVPPPTDSRQRPDASDRVRLSIHDLYGREVAVLCDDVLSPGSYSRSFLPRPELRLSSGIYRCVLTMAGTVQEKLLLLLR